MSKPMYRSNPNSAHHVLFLLLSHPSPDFCPFIHVFLQSSLSPPPPPSCYFALLCFLCCCSVFVIFILNVSELAEAHITDVQRTYTCVRRVCLCGHTQVYVHDVLRDVLAHTVYRDIFWIGFLHWPRCARGRENQLVHLKPIFNTKMIWKTCGEVGKRKPFHL